MKITLIGEVREYEAPMTALELAASLSQALKKEALAARIDGEVKDLMTVLDKDCEVEFLTFADDDGKRVYRHTASHILAQAVKAIRPNVPDSQTQLSEVLPQSRSGRICFANLHPSLDCSLAA